MESYIAARAAMMSLTNSKGRALNLIPNVLAVPPALEATARDILVADYINGTKNTMQGTAKPLVIPQLAGHDSKWFLLCTSRPIKPLIWQQRKKPKFVSKTQETDDNVFMKKTFLYGVDSRGNAGFGFWQWHTPETAPPKPKPGQADEGRERRELQHEREVREMLKDDALNAIIGDTFIEDPVEREAVAPIIEGAIADADAEIDGYLAKRYAVPLSPAPKVINKFSKDIAVYNLFSRIGIDESTDQKTYLNRYNAAIKFFELVADGKVSIGTEADDPASAAATGFSAKSNTRLFTRGSMRGM
ncbi:MAG: Mu-like prophage major head subunit gpT family protein [Sutterella wadsworthensis]